MGGIKVKSKGLGAILNTFSIFFLICQFKLCGAGGNALLEASGSDGKKMTFCVNYNNEFQHLPSSLDKTVPHNLLDFSTSQGCKPSDFNSSLKFENSAVAVSRGDCTFTQKANLIEAAKGKAAIIVDDKNSSKIPIPGGNASDYHSTNITLVIISFNDYQQVLQLSGPVVVKLFAPVQPEWDGNMLVIIFFSTLFVMLGAGWAAYNEAKLMSRSLDRRDEDMKGKESSDPRIEFTVWVVAVWFIVICAVLLLLYFFFDVMVYFFIGIFCLASSYSLYQCLLPLWSKVVPISYDIPVNRLPCIKSKIKLRSFLLYMPCLTLGIFWAVERHSKFAWTIQDLLGSSFCIYFIHNLRLPNLKVIAILLVLLLVYDVFFVFITPLFTKDGGSIMESVATGGSSHSKESLPMVFLVPLLGDNALIKCRERAYSLLGFGDIIIPGILLSYNAVFDVRKGTRMLYLICASVGYFVGMLVCMVSLVYMNSGQPALLYLVPGTLLTTVVIALVRGELKQLILGSHLLGENCNNQASVKDVEEGDANSSLDEEEVNLIN